jgi:RNA polymerase sigma factor (sigma-70 family)
MENELLFAGDDRMHIFEVEMKPHLDALYNFAYHLTYKEEDASDLVQDAYEKAYRSLDGYQKGTNAKAWLFRILKNTFINNYRKAVKMPMIPDFDQLVADHESDEEGFRSLALVNDNDFDVHMGDEITLALNDLPAPYREILLLSDIEDFSYEDIAISLDIPIGTVRSRLFRARNLMKEKLYEYAKANGFKDKRSK